MENGSVRNPGSWEHKLSWDPRQAPGKDTMSDTMIRVLLKEEEKTEAWAGGGRLGRAPSKPGSI